jgi:hypothetical protein
MKLLALAILTVSFSQFGFASPSPNPTLCARTTREAAIALFKINNPRAEAAGIKVKTVEIIDDAEMPIETYDYTFMDKGGLILSPAYRVTGADHFDSCVVIKFSIPGAN